VFSSDFADADLMMVSIGVGSFNQGQIGYFDDVEIVHDTYQAAYDSSLRSARRSTRTSARTAAG